MIKNKTITIFGSSFPEPDDDEYDFAYELGFKLGKAGFGICNGGFYGIMEATAKGACDAGSHTIGVTVNQFNLRANSFIKQEIRCKNLFERINTLISFGDGFIILKGGTGTLLEYSAILELINKNLIDKKPIVAESSFWANLTNQMNERNIFEGRKIINVFLSNDVDKIVSYFENYFKEMQ